MSKFPQPRNELVIIKPDKTEIEKVPEGTFKVPDELSPKPKTATVMISSPGYYAKETGVFIPIELKGGDRVLYNPFAGAPIKINGEEGYILLDEKDIKLKLN